MASFVRFVRGFTYTDPKSGQRTGFPANWAGEVSAEIEKEAAAVSALAVSADSLREDTLAPVNPGVSVPASSTKTGAAGGVGYPDPRESQRRGRSTPAQAEEEGGADTKTTPAGKDAATSTQPSQAVKA